MLEKLVDIVDGLILQGNIIDELEMQVEEKQVVIIYLCETDIWKKYKAVYDESLKNKILYKWILGEWKKLLIERSIL